MLCHIFDFQLQKSAFLGLIIVVWVHRNTKYELTLFSDEIPISMIQREIKGEMIKRVVTRFKYEAENVVFEILLRLHHIDSTVLVLRTYNYESFKKSYDGLKIAKQKNTTVILPQSGFNESWLEQAA